MGEYIGYDCNIDTKLGELMQGDDDRDEDVNVKV